jgi:hypothetical protein
MSFALAFLGFVLVCMFIGLVIIPYMRRGREKSFDALMFFQSLRYWT